MEALGQKPDLPAIQVAAAAQNVRDDALATHFPPMAQSQALLLPREPKSFGRPHPQPGDGAGRRRRRPH
jgi:hypothetical protein